jgi:hypothetical protein
MKPQPTHVLRNLLDVNCSQPYTLAPSCGNALAVELGAEFQRIVQRQDAVFDARLPVVELEPERVAVAVANESRICPFGIGRQQVAGNTGLCRRAMLI